MVSGIEQEKHLAGTVVPAATAAAHVACALADVIDLQPFSDKYYEAPVGAIAEQWAALGRVNCAGNVPQVNVIESVSLCSGANIADVYTKANKRPAVLSGSRALMNMVPQLFPLTAAKIPAVFHVASSNVRDDQSVRSDLSDLAVVRDTGAGLLSSGSAQEVHDLAVVAHLAAAKCSLPFVHVFDGARVAFEYANVKLACTKNLKHIAHAVESEDVAHGVGHNSPSVVAETVANTVEMVMGHVAEILDSPRMYAFEYSGPVDADVVVIATGVYAQVVDEGARRSRNEDDVKIGVLNVRLLRPFSVAHLLAALPKSVRRVCVLDQAGIAGKGPLFLDVVTAFHSDAQWASPMVVAGRVGVDSRGFTPSMAYAVITNLLTETPIPNFSVGVEGAELQGENPLPSLPLLVDAPQSTSNLTGQVILWHTGTTSSQAATLAADVLGPRLGLKVQQLDLVDSTQKSSGSERVTRTDLRYSPLAIVAEYPIESADCVVVSDPALLMLPQYKVLDSLATNGTLVINTDEDWDLARLDVELPNNVRRHLTTLGAKLVLVNSRAIAEEAGLPLRASLPWILQAVVLKHCNKNTPYAATYLHVKRIMSQQWTSSDPSVLLSLLSDTHVESLLHTVDFTNAGWDRLISDPVSELGAGAGSAVLVPLPLKMATRATGAGVLTTSSGSVGSSAGATLAHQYEAILAQLFGDRAAVANTNGSSTRAELVSTTPKSLEACYGSYVGKLNRREQLADHVSKMLGSSDVDVSPSLRASLATWHANRNSAVTCQRAVNEIHRYLEHEAHKHADIHHVFIHRTLLPKVSEWIVGGQRWAYDLQASGVHHVISSREDVNVLIIDTSPYDGSEMVKPPVSLDIPATKRDIGLYAMTYGDTYVASISLKSSHTQALRALAEADAFRGPSIILAHAPHGNTDTDVTLTSTSAVESGRWPLYRWNPALEAKNKDPFTLDSTKLKADLEKFLKREQHLAMVSNAAPVLPKELSNSVEYELSQQQGNLEREMDQRKLNKQFGDLTAGLNPQLNLLVLYGSDGGNASSVAEAIAKKAESSGCGEARCMEANSFKIEELSEEQHVVFVMATAGQGEDCANAKHFTADMLKSNSSLRGVNFAVFGLGDSHYWGEGTVDSARYFCKPATDLDTKLTALGATKLVDCGLGDDQDDDGYNTAQGTFESALWNKMGVTVVESKVGGAPEIVDDAIKEGSNFLRGMITEGLADLTTGKLLPEDTKLTKFHGIYQQDLRSVRDELDAKGLERAYSFMIRVGIPGGVASTEQYIAMDDICNTYANGVLKLTTRQAYQLHGVVKRNLKTTMKEINKNCMDTLAACGDVNRNVMGNPHIRDSLAHQEVIRLGLALNAHLKPRTSAYHEIWMDKKPVAGSIDNEPLYGDSYLPRKFKIAIAVPPLNDVDVFAHCCGFIAIVGADGALQGWNVTAGGGMGTTHGNKATYPRLSDVMGFCTTEQAVKVAESIMLVQRDHGERVNRKHARLKYTMEDHGVAWYRKEVEERSGFKLQEGRPFKFETNADPFGWKCGYDGLWSYTMFIESGYIKDIDDYKIKTALREIAEMHTGGEMTLTANQNLIIAAVPASRKPQIEALLSKWNINNGRYSAMRLHSMACVALPTCALAMAEAQTYLPKLITLIEEVLDECGLRHNAITIRMTGCPNGCARPYIAEIAFVGKAPGMYNMYLGAGFAGNRINKMYREGVTEEQIMGILTPMLQQYSREKKHDEHFGDWVIRAGIIEPTLNGHSFWDSGPENDLKTPSGTNQIYW